jgi:hypothetical protein
MNHSAVEILILNRHAFRGPLLLVPVASSLLILLLFLLMLVDHMRGLHEEAAFGNFQNNVALLLFAAVVAVVKDVLFSDFYLDVRRWRGLRWLLAGRGLPAAFLDFLTTEEKIIKIKSNQSFNNNQSKRK